MPRYAISDNQYPIVLRDLTTLEEWPLTTTLEVILVQEVVSMNARVEHLEKTVKFLKHKIKQNHEKNTDDRPEDKVENKS